MIILSEDVSHRQPCIYNELLYRDFAVDVGVVEYNPRDKAGKNVRTQLGIRHKTRFGISAVSW